MYSCWAERKCTISRQRNVQGLANIQLAAHTSTDDLELRVASLELECNIPEPVRGQATPEPKGPTGPSWAYSNMANLNFDEAAASAACSKRLGRCSVVRGIGMFHGV